MSLGAFGTSAGIVDRSDRGVLQFKGEQAHWFLDQLVTNTVEGLEAGQGVEALLLTPKGRITAVMRLISTGKSVHCDVDPGRVDQLREFFEGRVFTTKVEIADRTDEFAILTLLGPKADEVAKDALQQFVVGESEEDRALGSNLPGDEHHTVHFGSAALARVTRPVRGLDLWVRREAAAEIMRLLEQGGAEQASFEDYADLCAIEGLPRFGVDFDESFLPQEAALERVVHFSKGCYLGQEAVAMAQRGRVKRRLRHLAFEGPPVVGRVETKREAVGRVTSVGRDGPTGFGIGVLRTSVELGTRVEVVPESPDDAPDVEPSPAVIHELPHTSRGPEVPSARELRERLQGSR